VGWTSLLIGSAPFELKRAPAAITRAPTSERSSDAAIPDSMDVVLVEPVSREAVEQRARGARAERSWSTSKTLDAALRRSLEA
jgi:hypothetical protein